MWCVLSCVVLYCVGDKGVSVCCDVYVVVCVCLSVWVRLSACVCVSVVVCHNAAQSNTSERDVSQ